MPEFQKPPQDVFLAGRVSCWSNAQLQMMFNVVGSDADTRQSIYIVRDLKSTVWLTEICFFPSGTTGVHASYMALD